MSDTIFLTAIAERRAVSFRLTEWMMRDDEAGTLSEKSAGPGHRAEGLHRGCVLCLQNWCNTPNKFQMRISQHLELELVPPGESRRPHAGTILLLRIHHRAPEIFLQYREPREI